MTDAEKAAAYDKLIAAIAAALKAQGYGTPAFVSYADLKAQLAEVTSANTDLLSERDQLAADLAACEAKLPPPPPEREWRTVKVARTVSDWKPPLISIPGATITDDKLPDGTPATRFSVPGPGDYGGDSRCELQIAPAGNEGERWAYEWGIYVAKQTVIPTAFDKPTVVAQHHGNNQAGYGGGTSLDRDNTLWARIRGGHELSLSGSHDYEYEKDAAIGQIQRDRLHTIRLEILWHREHGEYRALLDGKLGVNLTDIPTWPLGDKDGDPTDNIMFRTGLYPQAGKVTGPMEMFTTPCKFEVAS